MAEGFENQQFNLEQHGQDVARTAVNSASYNVLVTDYIIGVTYTPTGAVTINLPAAATIGEGTVYHIKDEGGNAGTNNITVDGNDSETIDGETTKVINTNYACISVYCDGSNWFIY